MKNIKSYIFEKLKISKSKLAKLTLFPETLEELKKMIKEEIEQNGNECSLNHIDVRDIKDMSYLFNYSDFNGDISEWDVSNVKSMRSMFWGTNFNQPLNKWDVSNVENMEGMFGKSNFNQDISMWKINPNCKYIMMFSQSNIGERHKPSLPKNKMLPRLFKLTPGHFVYFTMVYMSVKRKSILVSLNTILVHSRNIIYYNKIKYESNK